MNASLTGDTMMVDGLSKPKYTRESGSSASGATSGSSARGGSAVTSNDFTVPMATQHSLRKALKARQILFDALGSGYKTTYREVEALMYLAAHPYATQQDLAESLSVSQQAISNWMKGWSTHKDGLGLLVIERDPDELRKVNITWTPKGQRLFEAVWAAMKGA
jgi:DNA-binding MarR family transcriptional regulator